MHTGDYLSTLVADNIHPGFLPVILFLLASVLAFATGPSRGALTAPAITADIHGITNDASTLTANRPRYIATALRPDRRRRGSGRLPRGGQGATGLGGAFSFLDSLKCFQTTLKYQRSSENARQEGGRVHRFIEGFPRLPAMNTLGQIWDTEGEAAAKEKAEQVGWGLACSLDSDLFAGQGRAGLRCRRCGGNCGCR